MHMALSSETKDLNNAFHNAGREHSFTAFRKAADECFDIVILWLCGHEVDEETKRKAVADYVNAGRRLKA